MIPLIYNKKLLNKKDIDLIEKSGKELYHSKKFGELLGYGKCAMNLQKNGYADYMEVDSVYLEQRLKAFLPSINIRHTSVEQFPFLKGLNAHYHVMNQENYQEALNILS